MVDGGPTLNINSMSASHAGYGNTNAIYSYIFYSIISKLYTSLQTRKITRDSNQQGFKMIDVHFIKNVWIILTHLK